MKNNFSGRVPFTTKLIAMGVFAFVGFSFVAVGAGVSYTTTNTPIEVRSIVGAGILGALTTTGLVTWAKTSEYALDRDLGVLGACLVWWLAFFLLLFWLHVGI